VLVSVPQVLAHRGARAAAPENTVEAFVRARELGADGVELDARRTADGGIVLSHDAVVEGVGVLAARTLDEIRQMRPAMPGLEEVLDVCEGMLVNIEIKNLAGDPDYDPDERVAVQVVELLARRGRRDRVLVSSFSLDAIDRVKRLDESIPTGFLTIVGFEPEEGAAIAAERGHQAIHPFVGSMPDPFASRLVERAHALGVDVNVWTVNDADEMRRLAAAGVDAIITDVPDVARAALSET
jgi:glycerophosphoryl diester phosphodiesterase